MPAILDGLGMAKKSEQPAATGPKYSSMKILPEDRLVISRLASSLGVDIYEVFARPDVREFFRHLLVAELQREVERHRGPKKSG